MKITVREAVIVEGKYDKAALSNIIDGLIIDIGGFAIFNDREKLTLIRRLADERGILILTDSDRAGFRIRSFIGGAVNKEKVRHAYIPDIAGRERRKSRPSGENKLGVEGMSAEILRESLERAGVAARLNESDKTPETGGSADCGKPVTMADLYADGICGSGGSSDVRRRLLERLGLPSRLSAKSMLGVINMLFTREEYKSAAESVKNGGESNLSGSQ